MISCIPRARAALVAFLCATGIGAFAGPPRAIDIVEASITGRHLTVKSVSFGWRERVVEHVEVSDNGEKQVKLRVISEWRPITEERTVSLESVEATDAEGKPIEWDRLAALLREPQLAVVGDVPVDKRVIFRDGTVFLAFAADGK